MKFTPDDPALTAYALGELSESESTSVARALENDESLQREHQAISSLAGLLSETLGKEPLSLGPERIAEIHRAGLRPNSDVLVLEHRKRSRRQSFLVAVGVAAVVVTGFVALSQFQVDQPMVSGPTEGGGGEDSGEVTSAGNSAELPGEITPTAVSGVRLPLNVSVGDPSFVARSLHSKGELPARDQFQIADWVNMGRVVVEPQLKVGEVEVYTELGPCSWSPDHSLLMVNLRPPKGRRVSMEADLSFNPERVKSAKLLGGAGEPGRQSAQSESLNSSQTLLYELQLIEGEEGVGVLNLETLEGDTGYLPLAGNPHFENKMSQEFTTAMLLGGFARWAASESRDREVLVSLSRKTRKLIESVSDEQTRFALDMILQTDEILTVERGQSD